MEAKGTESLAGGEEVSKKASFCILVSVDIREYFNVLKL
jgi:hypothetical protein